MSATFVVPHILKSSVIKQTHGNIESTVFGGKRVRRSNDFWLATIIIAEWPSSIYLYF